MVERSSTKEHYIICDVVMFCGALMCRSFFIILVQFTSSVEIVKTKKEFIKFLRWHPGITSNSIIQMQKSRFDYAVFSVYHRPIVSSSMPVLDLNILAEGFLIIDAMRTTFYQS